MVGNILSRKPVVDLSAMVCVKWQLQNLKVDLEHENVNILKKDFISVFYRLQSTRKAKEQRIIFLKVCSGIRASDKVRFGALKVHFS